MDVDVKEATTAMPKTAESMEFSQGGHLMSNTKCKLPNRSFKCSRKGFKEIHVPTPKKHVGSENELVPMRKLPKWARAAFTVPKLNQV